MKDSCGYDEFGQDLYGNQGKVQPFGYTGYQHDRIAGTYFAQAREYCAGDGRFGGVDLIKGNTAMPFSLNQYGYCWGNPMQLVDLDGAWPSLSDIGKGIKDAASNAKNAIKDTIENTDWKKVGRVAAVIATTAVVAVVAVAIGAAMIAAAPAIAATEAIAGTMLVGAVFGVAVTAGFEIGNELKTTGDVDPIKVLVKGAEGAVTGALLGSPLSVGAVAVGCAATSVISSIAIDEIDISRGADKSTAEVTIDVTINGAVAFALALFGGAGALDEEKFLVTSEINMVMVTMKRVVRTTKPTSHQALKNFIIGAGKYFISALFTSVPQISDWIDKLKEKGTNWLEQMERIISGQGECGE